MTYGYAAVKLASSPGDIASWAEFDARGAELDALQDNLSSNAHDALRAALIAWVKRDDVLEASVYTGEELTISLFLDSPVDAGGYPVVFRISLRAVFAALMEDDEADAAPYPNQLRALADDIDAAISGLKEITNS